jgi:uncharacterized membrane protein
MKVKKSVFLFIAMGIIYLNLEIFARAIKMDLVGWEGIKTYSLAGWTSLWMFPIGGLCGLTLGLLNEKRKMHMALMSLLGTLLIFSVEFTSGVIFNILLKMNIWDYSDLPLNIMGQISIVYFIPWFLISPLAMWIDDNLRHYMYYEEKPSGLSDYYLNIFRKKQI